MSDIKYALKVYGRDIQKELGLINNEIGSILLNNGFRSININGLILNKGQIYEKITAKKGIEVVIDIYGYPPELKSSLESPTTIEELEEKLKNI
ncbi:hypothetical protein GF352_01650 [archaeon]|nr:hypothetical protein [archaeon]